MGWYGLLVPAIATAAATTPKTTTVTAKVAAACRQSICSVRTCELSGLYSYFLTNNLVTTK
jgi:hypothetical protein